MATNSCREIVERGFLEPRERRSVLDPGFVKVVLRVNTSLRLAPVE